MLDVWVTRDESDDGPMATALRSAGLRPMVEPVITRRIVDHPERLITHLSAGDWLVLTSPFAADALSCDAATRPNVAVVGDATRLRAETHDMRVELVSAQPSRESLFDALAQVAREGIVCYPRSSLVKPPPPWPRIRLESPVLYHTRPRQFDRSIIDRIDVVAVASASAARAIGPVTKPVASIGSKTSAALRSLGMEVAVQARMPKFEALADAIADYAKSSRHHRA